MKSSIISVIIYVQLTLLSCSDTTEETIPAPPSNLLGEAISTTQIDLSWTDNSTNEAGFKIERKTGAEVYSVITTIGEDLSTYSDQNLNPNTTYIYRVYSYNSAGKSSTYSNEVSITTNGIPTLSTTVVSLITSSSASSGGIVSNNGGTEITARGIVWSTNPNPSISLTSKTIDGMGDGSFTSLLSNLNWDTKYYVRAYATNSIGTGYGEELSFNTVPITITTSPITNVGAFTATSGGTISSNVGETVVSKGIVWSLSPNPTVALPTKTSDGSGGAAFVSQLLDLTPSTTYYVRAFATNTANTSYGDELNFTTAQSLFTPGSGITDIDGNNYNTIIIGTQEWMRENLRTTKYSNGDLIPNSTVWANLTMGAWVYYNNDIQFNNIHGKLYNSYTVSDARNVCPTGWHVPTEQDWHTLTSYLGGEVISEYEISIAGGKMKSTGTQYWLTPNAGATNESGFTGQPSGYYANDDFYYMGMRCTWWSSTTKIIANAERFPTFNLYYNEGFGPGPTSVGTLNIAKNSSFGFSIRCIKD